MNTQRYPLVTPCLCLLLAAACTSLDSTTARGPATSPARETVGQDVPPPPPAKSQVSAAVGSVRLEQDCPDPVRVDAAATAEAGPSEQAKSQHVSDSARGESDAKRSWTCDQSTLQIKLDSTGSAASQVRIASLVLRDLQTDGIVASVASRGPSAWGPDSTYVPWNESIAAGAQMQVSYRLTPPDWGAVEAKLGGATSHAREFALEVTLEVDGKPLTVRSPGFRRAAADRADFVET